MYGLWLVGHVSLLPPRYWGFSVLSKALLCGSWCTKQTQPYVLHWSHTQSSFSPASHCCHLPFSLRVRYSWKDLPRYHGDVVITAECPYSTGPDVPQNLPLKKRGRWGIRDWSQVCEKTEQHCGLFSLTSSLSFETIWNVIAVISVFSQEVIHPIGNKTNDSSVNSYHIWIFWTSFTFLML